MTGKAEAVASKIAYTSSGGLTFFGIIEARDAAILIGIVITVLTYLTNTFINIYFKRKHLKVAEQAALANSYRQAEQEEDHRCG